MKAWHFTGDTLRDGSPIPAVGEWLKFEGEIIPCEQGLHASLEPFDALRYAPGALLHLVELRGDKKRKIKKHGEPCDKVVGCQRKIIASIDATDLMRQFARECALDVIHLWDAPEIVVNYLKTGDAAIRAAARAAARDAARDAAWAAARAAQRKKFNEMVYAQFESHL